MSKLAYLVESGMFSSQYLCTTSKGVAIKPENNGVLVRQDGLASKVVVKPKGRHYVHPFKLKGGQQFFVHSGSTIVIGDHSFNVID